MGPPASGFGPGVGYDSPEAYDQTARAALSFAEDENRDADIQPDYDAELTQTAVTRG